MNLLLLISAMDCGGAETHVYTLAKALRERGHTVTVASSGGALASKLPSQGIGHVTVPLHTRCPWRLLTARRRLKRLLKENAYTLLHAHSRIAALLAEPLAKRMGIPFVTTVHAHFRADPLRRRLSRWGATPIAVSEDLKHYLCGAYALSPDQVTVIPNGIAPPPPPPTTPTDQPRPLVFCSRLDLDCAEGAFRLCDVTTRLHQAFPTLQILLVGGGEALPALQARAKRINEATNAPLIRCVGAVTDPTPLFRSASAVVGVSRVALEAMAVETPVILAGNEGFLGVADEHSLPRAELTNLTCRGEPPITAEGLYHACAHLLSLTDPTRNTLGKRLAAYVREVHGVDKIAAATEIVYEKARQACPHPVGGRTVLCGYYGYGNTGDEALLRAAIQRARRDHPAAPLSALTKGGRRDEIATGIRCVKRTAPLAVARELKGAHTVVFGGGTLLQDATSLRSLAYYATLIRYAKRHGARVELWANGIHPPTTARGERILKATLRRCDAIGLRDWASVALAQRLLPQGHPVPLRYERDLAYATPPATPARVAFLRHHYRLGKRLAIIAPKAVGRGMLRILSEWLCTLRAEGVQLLFVPMYPKEDAPLCHRLAIRGKDRIATGLSPSDLVGLMEQCEIVCGMRLHALIFAASSHAPFVGFGTDPKIEAFCKENGGIYFTELY